MAESLCSSIDPEIFFPLSEGVDEAKAICSLCRVRKECLEIALRLEGRLSRSGRYGIWGGLTPDERAELEHPLNLRKR